ncbi:cell division protein ZapA [Granulosicoccus sp. 3-233]|uniref:cell division protein ZapA n=1 Tax=Granulosicoccus sp. 3-233 TaxID=3417969 RepID=UPI003D3348FD
MSNKPIERKQESGGNRPARLRILDKEVQISCKPGEEDDLLQAAAYIDRSMRDLRKRNTTSSIEKIAIVTAINTANALLKSRSLESASPQSDDRDSDIAERLSELNRKLEALLDENVANSTNPAE